MSNTSPDNDRNSILLSIIRSNETDSSKIVLCDSLESNRSRAEISKLEQRVIRCEANIHRLTQLIVTMAQKQNDILREVVVLHSKNNAAQMTPPNIETLESPTLSPSVQDATTEIDGSLSDSDSDDWNSLGLRPVSRAAQMTPPEIDTLDSPTSSTLSPSVQDATPELDGFLTDSDSDDWLVPLLTSWVPIPFTPPQSIRRHFSSLDRIEEEEEEEEEEEVEEEEQEDSSPLAPESQI